VNIDEKSIFIIKNEHLPEYIAQTIFRLVSFEEGIRLPPLLSTLFTISGSWLLMIGWIGGMFVATFGSFTD
jgi:hypothetical protein